MNMSRRMRWTGHATILEEKGKAYSVLAGRTEETTGKTKT
jgi:hypothetical protein